MTTPQPTAVGSSPDKGSQGGMFHVKHFAPSPRLCRALNTPRILNCVGLRVSHGDFSNRTRSALLRRALNTPRILNCVGLRVSHGDFSNRTRSALLRRALNTPRILNCVGLRVSAGNYSNCTTSALLRRALNTPRMAVEHLYHAFRLQLCLKDEISPGNVSFYPCFVTRQTLNQVFTSIIIRMVSVNKIDIIKLTGGFSWKDDAQAIRPGPLFC